MIPLRPKQSAKSHHCLPEKRDGGNGQTHICSNSLATNISDGLCSLWLWGCQRLQDWIEFVERYSQVMCSPYLSQPAKDLLNKSCEKYTDKVFGLGQQGGSVGRLLLHPCSDLSSMSESP